MAKKQNYSINGKPTAKVSNLAVSREGSGSRVMTAKWSLASDVTNSRNRKRATWADTIWKMTTVNGKKTSEFEFAGKVPTPIGDRENKANLANFSVNKKSWNRNSFYPKTNTKLTAVSCNVRLNNAKGLGAWASCKKNFNKPRTPTISALSRNADSGNVSCTIKTDAGQDLAERYDTRYQVLVYDSRTKKEVTRIDNASTSTEFNTGYDPGDQQALGLKDYIRIRVKAWARGFAGDSAAASRDYYVARPNTPTITSYSYSSLSETGIFIARLKTNATKEHPVNSVRLEIAQSTEYTKAAQVPNSEFEDSDAIDNANCTALSVSMANVLPEEGKTTWIRIKAVHDNFTVYSAYMRLTKLERPAPKEPTAADDNAWIISAESTEDGKGATVLVAWDKNGKDDSTGTELSWSTNEKAWTSTNSPSVYEFEWTDDTSKASGYRKSGEVTVEDLDMGEMHYFRARRYMDKDSGREYGAYSAITSMVPTTRPSSVELMPPPYIYEGQDSAFSWSFDSISPQKAWQLFTPSNAYDYESVDSWTIADVASALDPNDKWIQIAKPASEYPDAIGAEVTSIALYLQVPASSFSSHAWRLVTENLKSLGAFNPETGRLEPGSRGEAFLKEYIQRYKEGLSSGWSYRIVAYGKQVVAKVQKEDVILAEGQDPNGACIVPWSRLQGFVDAGDLVILGNQLKCKVRVSTGSDYVESEEALLRIVEPLSVGVDVAETITAQPVVFIVASDANASLRVTLLASGAVGDSATGDGTQHEGDTIYSNAIVPEWTVSDDGNYYSVDLALPADLDLRQNASYVLNVEATDVLTEAVANASAEFKVDWARKAQKPSENIEVDGVVETDEQGDITRKAIIRLAADSGMQEAGDVYDIYRVGLDSSELVAQGVALDAEIEDLYAPFGERKYRVVTRTVNGDTDWLDFDYELEGTSVRIDWPSGYVELPYNIEIQDQYAKDVEVRTHLDGEPQGYWNLGVERKSGISTDIIKVEDEELARSIRELANYPGAVFVRTPDGDAYQANVDVSGLDRAYSSAAIAVAFDAQKLACTEFMATIPPTEESE